MDPQKTTRRSSSAASYLSDLARGMRVWIGFAVTIVVAGFAVAYAATWGSLPSVTTNETLSSTAWNDVIGQLNQLAGAIQISGANVGIGTATPDNAKLHVAGGTLNLDNNQAIAWGGGTARPGMKADKTDSHIEIHTSGTERIRVMGDGKVGIGTSAPASKLEVNGDIKATNAAKAWVIFDGTTMTVMDSYGVASVTRATNVGSVGAYKITWTVPFTTNKYAVIGACNAWGYNGNSFTMEGNAISGNTNQGLFTTYATVGCRVASTNANADSNVVMVVAYGK